MADDTFAVDAMDNGEDCSDAFVTYQDAVDYVNGLADEWDARYGGQTDRAWASRDNLYAAHYNARHYAQIVRGA